MKVIFVVGGLSWLVSTLGLAFRSGWALPAMLIAAVATLWYLPVGTIFSIIQMAGLIWLRRAV
jgi:hypothetical protein